MKVLLINIDSVIPNLALKKIENYHLDKGDEVIWDNELYRQLVDKIYVSCVFDWNKDKCKEWEGIAEIGGSGYDIYKVLPYYIDIRVPKINIGFTSRGCIRKCSFCIVPEKEGKIKATGDIYHIWDGQSKNITLLDNNILALPKHFEKICEQIKRENLIVDFNQGLDIRLLNEDNLKILKSIKKRDLRFAFDNWDYKNKVIEGIELLEKYNIHNVFWYVYTDGNIENTMNRLELLKSYNHRPYLMRDKKCRESKPMIQLARWVNQQHLFQKKTFNEFMEYDKQYNKK